MSLMLLATVFALCSNVGKMRSAIIFSVSVCPLLELKLDLQVMLPVWTDAQMASSMIAWVIVSVHISSAA